MAWTGLSMRLARAPQSLRAGTGGLSVAQMIALHVLMFEGPLSVSGLTARLGLSLSATSTLVQRLVEQGLVERAESAKDRRQRYVSLSRAGKRLVDQATRSRLAELRQSVEHLSPRTRDVLRTALEQTVSELRTKERDAFGDDVHGRPPDERTAALAVHPPPETPPSGEPHSDTRRGSKRRAEDT